MRLVARLAIKPLASTAAHSEWFVMKAVPLTRARHAGNFAAALRSKGIPTERYLEVSHLPVGLLDQPVELEPQAPDTLATGRVHAADVTREGLLMAPAYAVSDLLDDAGLTLQDFDYYEIHEAFAAQTLATLAAWESERFCAERLYRGEPLGSIDRDKLNVNGGSVAIGHPFAATGARLLATLSKQLAGTSGRGLISVCTAGGMGVTAIVEAA